MKRYLSILLCILNVVLSTSAQSVSQDVAVKAALNYWNTEHLGTTTTRRMAKRATSEPTYSAKTISPNDKAPLYVVQMEDGWMLMSSEKAAEPVLAYSPTGKFPDFEDMPDGMQWLISYYEEANAFAHDNLNKKADANEEWDELIKGSKPNVGNRRNALAKAKESTPKECVLERMAQVHWGQHQNNDYNNKNSYNAQCPTWYSKDPNIAKIGGCAYVGCLAVAMGQIMWYYQWPHAGIIPFHVEPINKYVEDVHMETYNWSHIPAELHSSTDPEDANMFASFLRDCCYATKMQFEKIGSHTSEANAVQAMEECFRYKSTIQCKKKGSGWIATLKKEISEGRPVIYSADPYNSSQGHAFVLYGYNSKNQFRVNWGWKDSKYTNTYYSLNALSESRINGITATFSENHKAIIGIEPNYPECGQDYVLYNTVVPKLPFLFIHYSGVITTSAELGPLNNDYGHIRSSQFGYIYSGEEVRLKAPFYIDKGANVHIAIRDAHCGGRNNMPAKISDEIEEHENDAIVAANEFYVSPNPATDYIEIHSSATLKNISIINSNGQCVMHSMNTYIPTYSLPSGLYIVRALTEDNNMLQTKFLKQ